MSKSLLLVFLPLLGGCGFHMQGAATTPEAMQQTYIEAVDRNSLFHRELRQAFRASGVEIVDAAGDATAVFTISADETGQRVLSVSARNVPTEYEVFYTVEYALTSGADSLLTMQNMTLTRDYTYDITQVLGKAHEEDLLREALVKDLVRIVLKQLSSL